MKKRSGGRIAIVCAAILIALVLLLGLGVPLLYGSWGQNVPGNLARWQALNIQEYEITSQTAASAASSQTLRVDTANSTIMLVDPASNTARDVSSIGSYRDDTVAGLFRQAQHCEDESAPIQFWIQLAQKQAASVCSVQYDSTLGYPKHFSGRLLSSPRIADSDWSIAVTDLRVLKQGAAPTPTP